MTEYPVACFVIGDDVIFDSAKIPEIIQRQYAFARDCECSGYGDDPPEMPRWKETEISSNPIKNKLPLRPFETGTLLDVVEEFGVYAVWRHTAVWQFVIVEPMAAYRGYAHRGNGARWFDTCWIRESKVWKEADHAWEWIQKICCEMAAKRKE